MPLYAIGVANPVLLLMIMTRMTIGQSCVYQAEGGDFEPYTFRLKVESGDFGASYFYG